MVNFIKAVKAMKEGKRMYMKSWIERKWYWYIEDGEMFLEMPDETGEYKRNVTPGVQAILAKDWVEYKDEDKWNLKEISHQFYDMGLLYWKVKNADLELFKQKVIEDIFDSTDFIVGSEGDKYFKFDDIKNKIHKRSGF